MNLFYFFITFVLSALLTLLVKTIASKLKVVDYPDSQRHWHSKPTPLWGGIGIFLAFWAVIIYLLINPIYGLEKIKSELMIALVSGTVIFLVGIADDLRPFSAKWRLLLVALAVFIAALYVPWLTKITNPWGGYIELGAAAGAVLVFFWLTGMTYTVKILDGLDGLAAGIVAIGALVIVLLTSATKFYQPNVALVALIFLGACLGFLLFNFYPAKIFLGESGSLFLGFMLGILAIIGGGKLATALLVMAIPAVDLARVATVRWRQKRSLFEGDREHLHFRLVDAGLGQRQAVLLLYFLAFSFGLTTLFLQSLQKVYTLFILVILAAVLSHWLGRKK